jgi:ATP-dependent protease ClpP protease subunit
MKSPTSADGPTHDLPTNRLWLGTGFDTNQAECHAFIKTAVEMDTTLDVAQPLLLILDSCGSYDVYGWMIYDVLGGIARHRQIHVYAVGMCCSMAMLLLQCASSGHRYISSHLYSMIHDGKDSWDAMRPRWYWASLRRQSASNKWQYYEIYHQAYMTVLLARIREKQPQYTIDQFTRLLRTDTHFTAAALIAFGLADAIWTDLP